MRRNARQLKPVHNPVTCTAPALKDSYIAILTLSRACENQSHRLDKHHHFTRVTSTPFVKTAHNPAACAVHALEEGYTTILILSRARKLYQFSNYSLSIRIRESWKRIIITHTTRCAVALQIIFHSVSSTL